MKFYDIFPGLSKSNEVYFGRNAPLAQTLLTYTEKINEFFSDPEIIKKKTFYSNLMKLCTEFGNAISKDVNAETCGITISPDKEVNASAIILMSLADSCYKYKDKDTDDDMIGVNFDKIADIEDIVVGTDGYTFRNKKNKVLIINLNYGLFNNNLTVEEISAIICHEIGHCFQQGIFGVYKNVADICLASIVKSQRNRFNKGIMKYLPLPKLTKLFLSYLWFPNLLNATLFAKFRASLNKKWFGKLGEDTTYKMKDKIKEWDEGNEETKSELLTEDRKSVFYPIRQIIRTSSQQYNDKSRKDLITDMQKDNKDQWKDVKLTEEDKIRNKLSQALINFFRSIVIDFNLLDSRITNVLALNSYNQNLFAKTSFYKRYEFFADVFATSYGFGPDLYKSLNKINKFYNDKIDKELAVGLNKIPFNRAFYKISMYKLSLDYSRYDCHGDDGERARNTYTALVQELKTNPTLTSDQKKAIQQDIEILIKSDEAYYEESKETGFWFKYYNKLIDRRINGKLNEDTIKEVLEPIEEICKTS